MRLQNLKLILNHYIHYVLKEQLGINVKSIQIRISIFKI